jgi:glucosylceramidase
MKNYYLLLLSLLFACGKQQVEMVSTSQAQQWQRSTIKLENFQEADVDIEINSNNEQQTIEGFGTCFNELGWASLSRLKKSDRENIFRELFQPNYGANFTICRMPVAANDFAIKWYSFSQVANDFDMNHFSIENDKKTLVPFIKQAQKFNPQLKLWASPWSPPQWMKYNKHYALRSDKRYNDLTKDREGVEGTDMFIQESKYYQAYALYFKRFVEEYRKQGINIPMIMPQNEFNSVQNFPSCTWKSSSLATFIGKYLGPEMAKIGVEVMFGTMERGNEALVDTILNDPDCKKFVNGVGFQWAGKHALPGINKRYPNIKLYQTEQECGNGKNDWAQTIYSWNLMKHYLNNGVNAYMYWNTSLDEGGISTWGWKQNSLVVVNPKTNTYKFSYEYYLMKHVSHFVKPGAKLLTTEGKFKNVLAFKNPDKSTVVVIYNSEKNDKKISLKLNNESYTLQLKADSFSSLKF